MLKLLVGFDAIILVVELGLSNKVVEGLDFACVFWAVTVFVF